VAPLDDLSLRRTHLDNLMSYAPKIFAPSAASDQDSALSSPPLHETRHCRSGLNISMPCFTLRARPSGAAMYRTFLSEEAGLLSSHLTILDMKLETMMIVAEVHYEPVPIKSCTTLADSLGPNSLFTLFHHFPHSTTSGRLLQFKLHLHPLPPLLPLHNLPFPPCFLRRKHHHMAPHRFLQITS
jgi:hypothetical protein